MTIKERELRKCGTENNYVVQEENRKFCSSIGREIQLDDVWSMIKKMSGERKYAKISVS